MSKGVKQIIKEYGLIGQYILQSLEVMVSRTSNLKLKMSSNVVSNMVESLSLTSESNRFGKIMISGSEAQAVIRSVISIANKDGYIVITTVKGTSHLSFPHLKSKKLSAVSASKPRNKTREISGNKPKDIDEVVDLIRTDHSEVEDPVFTATEFYDYWQERGWRRKTGDIKDWKATLRRWIRSPYNNKSDSLPNLKINSL